MRKLAYDGIQILALSEYPRYACRLPIFLRGIQNSDELEALAVILISSTKGGLQYKRVLRDDFFSKILEQLKDLLK